MKIRSSAYLLIVLVFAFLIACDGGGDSDTAGGSSGGGPIILDDSDSGQDPGGSPPSNPVPPGQLNDFQSLMLDIVNEARSQSRNCGTQFFAAAPDVIWDERIEVAAQMHSEDMAASGTLSHSGSDGSDAGDRLLMENYDWFTWGENILFGLNDAQNALDALLDSPSHCSLIMGQDFLEVGAGSARGGNSTYWTILFATESN